MLRCELIGNLGADCEVKESNGSKFVTMRVAHTTRLKQDDGTVKERTDWVDVTWNKTDSGLLPYLKAGTKIYVRGDLRLRVYSSKKDRCMKAGAQIAAVEIELLDGARDQVPRQLIDPDNGQIFEVGKYFCVNCDTSKMKKDEQKALIDTKGGEYLMVKGGWVAPKPEPEEESTEPENKESEKK